MPGRGGSPWPIPATAAGAGGKLSTRRERRDPSLEEGRPLRRLRRAASGRSSGIPVPSYLANAYDLGWRVTAVAQRFIVWVEALGCALPSRVAQLPLEVVVVCPTKSTIECSHPLRKVELSESPTWGLYPAHHRPRPQNTSRSQDNSERVANSGVCYISILSHHVFLLP